MTAAAPGKPAFVPPVVQCPYCRKPAKFHLTSEVIYHGRDYGPVFACMPCQAWVGAHRDSLLPMGRLANAPLRRLKQDAHRAFDPLWRDLRAAYPEYDSYTSERTSRVPNHLKQIARSMAYQWLSAHLGIPQDLCHIGMFDEEQCGRCVYVIQKHQANSGTVRTWAKANKVAKPQEEKQ